MAIPWRSLGIDPSQAPPSIGFNISRDHARRNATYDWALMPPPYGALSASLYGRLGGFEQLPKRAALASRSVVGGWHVNPYVLAGRMAGRTWLRSSMGALMAGWNRPRPSDCDR